VLKMRLETAAPFFDGQLRQVALVAQKVVYDENARLFDAFLDRFVATVCPLVEREWERFRLVYRNVFVKQYLFGHVQNFS
jgi:hypothetical protein